MKRRRTSREIVRRTTTDLIAAALVGVLLWLVLHSIKRFV
jgi:hypothetical protein